MGTGGVLVSRGEVVETGERRNYFGCGHGGHLWEQDEELDGDDHGYEARYETSSISSPWHLLSHRIESTISKLAEQGKI
jgi:hypothetical protein